MPRENIGIPFQVRVALRCAIAPGVTNRIGLVVGVEVAVRVGHELEAGVHVAERPFAAVIVDAASGPGCAFGLTYLVWACVIAGVASHRAHGVRAVWAGRGWQVGTQVEWIEPRICGAVTWQDAAPTGPKRLVLAIYAAIQVCHRATRAIITERPRLRSIYLVDVPVVCGVVPPDMNYRLLRLPEVPVFNDVANVIALCKLLHDRDGSLNSEAVEDPVALIYAHVAHSLQTRKHLGLSSVGYVFQRANSTGAIIWRPFAEVGLVVQVDNYAHQTIGGRTSSFACQPPVELREC